MRKARLERKTKETKVKIELNLDGKGNSKIHTTVPFLDHMLALFAKHGLFDLKIEAKGDTEIDDHHLVEDIGITLGEAIKKCLREKRGAHLKGINRYGYALIPMDESLVSSKVDLTAVDISGRPYLVYQVKFKPTSVPVIRTRRKEVIASFDFSLLKEFFRALVNSAGITLHFRLEHGENNHHIAEALFKSFGKALKMAVEINQRIKGVPSTKGRL